MGKTNSRHWLWLLVAISLIWTSVSLAQAAEQEIKPLKEWQGRIDRGLQKAKPARGFISSQAELDRLWTAWQIPGDKPPVDFKAQVLLVGTCNCSRIWLSPLLNDQGNLNPQVIVTKDLREDTAYIVVLIPRRGVRTIAGKPLEAN